MVDPKLTDIFKDSSEDSACVEDSVGATADASEDISFEEISAGAPRKQTEVVVVQERRRRYSAQEKIEFVKLTYAPGNSVSSIARQFNISSSLLFKWRELYKGGGLAAITSGTETASAKAVAQLKDEIKRLHRLVGRQAADLELYKEAMEMMCEKLACAPILLQRSFHKRHIRRLLGLARSHLSRLAKPAKAWVDGRSCRRTPMT